MWNPSPLSSLPLKIAFIISFYLTASSSSYSPPTSNPRYHSISIPKVISKKPSTTTATAGDIHTLLGTPQQVASVDPQVVVELQSCFKFIIPFNPTTNTPPDYCFNLINRLSQSLTESGIRFPRHTLNDAESYQNELIWSPPAPMLEIARLAFDSGGDLGSIQGTLDPTMIYIVKAQMKIDVNLQDILIEGTF
ncbi:unnamed protein product [Lactuca saligna]|uniref:Uncharacterized protein n=1 Tax=Lactuca saligna TaxID=75948 RepID=A0AA35Z0F6_LACSI|nr:unnamed protein product [Lactuca saligna]